MCALHAPRVFLRVRVPCVHFRAEQAWGPSWCDSVINLHASVFTPPRGEGIQPAGDTDRSPLAAHARKHAPMHTGAYARANCRT